LIDEANAALWVARSSGCSYARALYKQPEILFLDEATSHLDAALDSKISETVGH
jgi:ATP-binding cassette subfamily B protein RaxB